MRPVSRTEIAAFFEIRASLEALAARRAAERRDAAALAALEAAQVRLEQAVAGGADREHQTARNADFHAALYAASGNVLVARLVDDLEAITARRVLERLYEQADPARTIADHRALLAAIASGDADEAARAAAVHVERSATELLAVLDASDPALCNRTIDHR